MAANDEFMVAGATGIASVAPLGTSAPTGVTALTAPWVDLGSISDDGLVEAVSENRTSFTRWGSLAPNKTALTSSAKTFQVTFWESNEDVLGLYFRLGTAPSPTAGIVDFADSATPDPDYRSMVFDVIEGTNALRIYLPKCEVTDRGNITYKSDTLVGYQVTMTAYPGDDNAIGHRWYKLDAFADESSSSS